MNDYDLETQSWFGPIWLQVPRADLCTACIEAYSMALACPAHTENNVQLVNTLTRSGAKGCAKETDVGTTQLLHYYSELRLQPRSMLTRTNSCAWASL
jgi:hypothetical protein